MAHRAPEQRRHPRYAVDCQVLAGELGVPTLRARGWTLDIGPGGCRMICDETLKPGLELRMLLVVRGRLVLVAGRVRHESCLGDAEYEVGVQFGRVRPHAASALAGLCATGAPPPLRAAPCLQR